ncbi:hypothetical protein AWJ20_3043 [Sugiyamaella lignohabitans]|uniref:Uncharacterized protein n=1 Tax=Sugiyamaella lignohabitans TaxID=796027 RepID=A0A167FKJ9_9ASCO|nr:uncharacterized protein AWJ20_3043 [Sugiyamaella lignohabitans]ANB15416.1 hypothetical protein AWJ20_3043 [Sugiyamaella lignohabitans]
MFLARAFPLNEKSGLNMRGTFNVENVTIYESAPPAVPNSLESLSMEVDENQQEETIKETEEGQLVTGDPSTAPGEADKTAPSGDEVNPSIPSHIQESTLDMPSSTPSTPIPSVLSTPSPEDTNYSDFWSLQSILSNPTILFTNEKEMSPFKRKVKKVMALFLATDEKSHTSHDPKRTRNGSQHEQATTHKKPISPSNLSMESEKAFVPKWLTKRDLFELQLKDAAFRRSFLVQLYIISDFLLGQSSRAKEFWNSLPASNRSVMFPYVLKGSERKYFSDLNQTIKQLISDGSSKSDLNNLFEKTLTTTIFRDHNWQYWKLRNCPSFEKPSLDESLYRDISEKFTSKQQPRKKYWFSMGTAALSKAWKIETGLDKLKDPERYVIPSAVEYYEKIKKLRNPDSSDDLDNQKDKEENLSSLTWRGLRAARDHGMWSKFSQVTKERGFSGLFGEPDSHDQGSELTRASLTPDFIPSAIKEDEQQTVVDNDEPSSKITDSTEGLTAVDDASANSTEESTTGLSVLPIPEIVSTTPLGAEDGAGTLVSSEKNVVTESTTAIVEISVEGALKRTEPDGQPDTSNVPEPNDDSDINEPPKKRRRSSRTSAKHNED